MIDLKGTDWDNEPKSEYVYLDKIDEMSDWLRIYPNTEYLIKVNQIFHQNG